MTDIDEMLARIARDRRAVSDPGRQALAAAVSLDHDWALPASGHDKLMETLGEMSAADLEAAALLAGHLQEAITCLLIRSDMAKHAEEQQ